MSKWNYTALYFFQRRCPWCGSKEIRNSWGEPIICLRCGKMITALTRNLIRGLLFFLLLTSMQIYLVLHLHHPYKDMILFFTGLLFMCLFMLDGARTPAERYHPEKQGKEKLENMSPGVYCEINWYKLKDGGLFLPNYKLMKGATLCIRFCDEDGDYNSREFFVRVQELKWGIGKSTVKLGFISSMISDSLLEDGNRFYVYNYGIRIGEGQIANGRS